MIREDNVRLIFGLKLKHHRQRRSLSLAALSKLAGLSASYLNEIEKGKKYPKTEKIVGLANVFGVSYDELVSLRLPPHLAGLEDLLKSNLVTDLPLNLFGFDLSKMVEWLSMEPAKVATFVSTIAEIARNYDMRKEQFYFTALRSYQEVHENYFEQLEEGVNVFVNKYQIDTDKAIRYEDAVGLLENKFNYAVKEFDLSAYPELQGSRYVFVPGAPKNVLLINPKLNDNQRLFIVARELTFNILKTNDRPQHSVLVQVPSFDQILNNFKASYCAAAMFMPSEKITADLKRFLSLNKWDGKSFLGMMRKYQVSPENFFHRITNILPKFFGVRQLFFIRFQNNPETDHYDVTRELHFSSLHNPHGNDRARHYCRRWQAVKLLQSIGKLQAKNGASKAIVTAQRIRYVDTDNEYFCITIARPMAPTPDLNASVTLGFLLTTEFKAACSFWNDPSIEETVVNETCETCRLTDCSERAAPAELHQKEEKLEAIRSALDRIKEEVRMGV